LVTGIVVLMIGLTLIRVGLISMGGGYGALADGSFANGPNLLLSCTVLAIIVIVNRLASPWLRSASLILALIAGYVLAAAMGMLDLTAMREADLFHVPRPLHFGIGFSWALFVPMIVIYLVTSL